MDTVETVVDDILEHHGIKGMKWGVRRSVGRDGHVQGSSATASSSDHARASESRSQAKKHGLHTLSNQELEHLTKRMGLERRYSELNSKQSSGRVHAGGKIARDLMVQVGKQQVQNVANQKIAEQLIKKGVLKKS